MEYYLVDWNAREYIYLGKAIKNDESIDYCPFAMNEDKPNIVPSKIYQFLRDRPNEVLQLINAEANGYADLSKDFLRCKSVDYKYGDPDTTSWFEDEFC